MMTACRCFRVLDRFAPHRGVCLPNGVVDQTQGGALIVAICMRDTPTRLCRQL
jgi:hypothetical protein